MAGDAGYTDENRPFDKSAGCRFARRSRPQEEGHGRKMHRAFSALAERVFPRLLSLTMKARDGRLRCNSCDELHEGVPTFDFNEPANVHQIPESERGKRVELGTDDCVVTFSSGPRPSLSRSATTFGGYLGSVLPRYPDTFNLNVVMHPRGKGTRPLVEETQSAHPLHVEQCGGMSQARLIGIYEAVVHGTTQDEA